MSANPKENQQEMPVKKNSNLGSEYLEMIETEHRAFIGVGSCLSGAFSLSAMVYVSSITTANGCSCCACLEILGAGIGGVVSGVATTALCAAGLFAVEKGCYIPPEENRGLLQRQNPNSGEPPQSVRMERM